MYKTKQELEQLCFYFYYAHGIPVYLFELQSQILHFPEIPPEIDPLAIHSQQVLSSQQTVSYYVTDDFIYYGKVQIEHTPYTIVTGPVTSTLSSRETIHAIMKDAFIAHKHLNAFSDFFQQIPILSFHHLQNILCFLHFLCNDKCLSPDQLTDIDNHTYEIPVSEIHASNYFMAKEEQRFHNTHKFEQEYYSYVENGDVEGLNALMQKPLTIQAGIVADNNIRQIKNLFIASTTLITRAAIKGGLDIETAYQLSDISIREMEKLSDHTAINALQLQTVLDFTKRVRETKIPKGVSPAIYECVQYIAKHTNQPLTVQTVAKTVGFHRSYLSKKFKKEMGFEISAFIMRCKLEEAKSLLAFTDKSVSEISNYLCFSSQSYFQNVFKKKYGITPKEFREKPTHE